LIRRPIVTAFGAVGAAFLAAACAVGPTYTKPTVPTPSAYKEPLAAEASAGGPWKAAEPRDELPRGRWWEVFGDPQLNALEEEVAASNPNVAQADGQFREARAAVRGARSELFPTVTASASVVRSRPSADTPSLPAGVSRSAATTYELPVDLSYEADVWGRVRRNAESSVAAAQASAADLETVRLTMQAELAVDYLELHGLDAQEQLLDSTVEGYEKALQLTVNRHAQGIVSGVDVAQAETQLHTTGAQATDLGVMRAQLEHAIAILVGKPPAAFAIPKAALAVRPPAIPVALPAELLERRPDVASAERRMAAANAQIGVAKAAFFPQLLLSASGGAQSARLADFLSVPSRFWSIGASLVGTLFDGGKRRAALQGAEASYDATVAVYRESVLTAFQEVEDNLAALAILGDEAGEQADAVAAAERALVLARNRYEAGVTTYLEVVTAQSTALANERTAVDLLTRRMTASVNLVKALGGGWRASDLTAGDVAGAVEKGPPRSGP
jgi:NodT family efflux transporter outer membrane factor (OMF) lipoprotein